MINDNTSKEWLDLNLYPAKPGYKWRAQDQDGRVFDYSVKPVELSEAGYPHWDDAPDAEFSADYVGQFEVLGNWKDMRFNLNDVTEKQRKTPFPITNPSRINHFSPRSVETNDILTVIAFAAERHKNQRRKDKDATPYINHPLAVAKMLSDHGVTDQDTIFAALLHDVIEDTETTIEEVSVLFGQSVADMVMEVTDDKSLPKAERKLQQVETASSKSLGARLIKIADKVHNLQSMIDAPPHNWTPERVKEYFDWSKQVVDQMRGTHAELETLFDLVYDQGKSEIQSNVKTKYYVVADPISEYDCLYKTKPQWNEGWGTNGFVANYETGIVSIDFDIDLPDHDSVGEVYLSDNDIKHLEIYLVKKT